MVNNRQALSATRVLVTMYGAAITPGFVLPASAVGAPSVISDTMGVQGATIIGQATHAGVPYDVASVISVVVDVATLPVGVTFPGAAVACSLAEAATTAGLSLSPVQPSIAELGAIARGATTFGGVAGAITGVTADGILGNLALGLGAQPGAHLLASGVADTVTIGRGESTLEKLAYTVGLLVRIVGITWALYIAVTWLWARRPAVLRSGPRALGWGAR